MTRVAIVEDKEEIAAALRDFFDRAENFSVTAVFAGLNAAKSGFVHADVVILDVQLPDGSGPDLIAVLRKKSPGVKILMYTVVEDSEVLLKAMGMGANGYLLKDTPPAQMLDYVRVIMDGGITLSPAIAAGILGLQKRKPEADILTPREIEVLRNLTLGMTAGEIGRVMDCASATVKKHLENIYRKIDVKSKSGAILFGIESGILQKR